MSLTWMPVAPDLNAKGAFISLNQLKNADNLKPAKLEAGDESFTQFKVFQKQLSTSTAVELGVAPIGSGSTSIKSFTFIYEAMIYSDKIVDQAIGDVIYGTRWGAGLRVSLKVSDIKGSFNVGFGAIAASSEVGLAKVEYEISGIGISNGEILKVLPGPGDFNYESYRKILTGADKVKKYIADNHDELSPKPFQILIKEPISMDPMQKSKSVLYAINCIIDRKSLNECLTTGTTYNSEVLEYVYQQFGITSLDQKPSINDKREARNWLDV